MILAIALAAQLTNPGFERGLEGWQAIGHRGIGASVVANRSYSSDRAPQGRHYLAMGWRARNSILGAEKRLFTSVDARRYRGRTIRVSALTRAPAFAHGNGRLVLRVEGAEAQARIAASENWQRHGATLRIPRDARRLEIAFEVRGASSELAVDDVRIALVRR
ncbi:MAG TPA: hypothetical protein VMG08_12205 [Allosphingosinicella sp.]|nr:hypothetical protein [Allosphingosinicella sp.]